MNKILIVGHESTQYQKLEKILQSYGMLKPALSHTHKMTPQQIGQQIAKAAKILPSDKLPVSKKTTTRRKTKTTTNDAKNVPISNSETVVTQYSQKHPKKIWDALAFDLILANTEQDFWGWSDSDAINLLDYWANFDEDMVFVLTYDRPHVLIENLVKHININELTDELIYKTLDDWCDYNKELLDFYHKYPKRCILVNGEQVVHSAQHYVDSVAKKIMWQPHDVDESKLQLIESDVSEKNQTIRFFVDQLLSSNHNLITIFSLLQESASIPWDNAMSVYNQLDLLKFALREQMEVVSAKHSLLDAKQIYELKERDWQVQLDAYKESHQQDRKALDDAKQLLNTYQKENQLVANQLHQVQEELEKYYLENQKNQDKLKVATQEAQTARQLAEEQKKQVESLSQAKQKAEQTTNEQKKQLEQAIQTKQQLEKQLSEQKQQNQEASVNIQQENELLITQLHQVQEELEKYYLESQKNQDKLKVATQEAQTARQLVEEQKKHVESLSQAKQKAEQTTNEQKKQLEQAIQTKQQLEKQLSEQKQQNQEVSVDIQQENELLIAQLHQVQEELEKYYLENQRLKSEHNWSSQPAKPVYYGAADRVKQDLPYRLGSTVVSHSKSTRSLAKLPFALAQEYRAFQKQQEVQGELPPVEEYQDSYEAEKVKKHLSYRLGKTLVDGAKSPKGLLGLPTKLGGEIIGFAKKQKN